MLDTLTRPATATTAPRRRVWDDNDDLYAITQRAMGASDEDVGAHLGRSAKAVAHRRVRLAALHAAQPARAAPAGSALDIAERRYLDAQAAAERAHDAYNDAMQPYLAPVAEALRRAGVLTTPDDGSDREEGEAAWRVVEALRRVGVEIRVP